MTYTEMELTLARLAEMRVENQQLLRDTLAVTRRLDELVVRLAEEQQQQTHRVEG